MSDLTDFLLARIAEDEGEAHVVSGGAEPIPLAEGLWAGEEGVMIATPARALAECEAKRRIVEERIMPAPTRLRILRLLALPYADHPDYDPSWRP